MSYTFRHRFNLRQPGALGITDQEWLLEEGPPRVSIKSIEDLPLSKVAQAILRGDGYLTEAEARRAGLQWRSRLERVFACNQVPVDFGDRAAKGFFFEVALRRAGEAAGGPVLNDVHGLMIFESDPAPVAFLGMGPWSAYSTAPQARLVATLNAEPSQIATTNAESIAFDLYSSSFGSEPDARFMLLMMALETLIEQESRDDATQQLIDRFIQDVRATPLPDTNRQSLIGSLSDLKRESIGQAGRRLVRTLIGQKYGDHDPIALFNLCYDLRSRLVHGTVPRPPRDEVGALAAPLEVLVGDLIAGPDLAREVRQQAN